MSLKKKYSIVLAVIVVLPTQRPYRLREQAIDDALEIFVVRNRTTYRLARCFHDRHKLISSTLILFRRRGLAITFHFRRCRFLSKTNNAC